MAEFFPYTDSKLFTSTASATVSNTTTETTIIGTGSGSLTLPVNYLSAGRALIVHASGVYSTQAVPITLRLKVKMGSTILLDTGVQTPTGALTNRRFVIEGRIICRTAGAPGTVFCQGESRLWTSAILVTGWEMLNTATANITTTSTQVIDVTAQWGAGVAAADSITGSVVIIGRA